MAVHKNTSKREKSGKFPKKYAVGLTIGIAALLIAAASLLIAHFLNKKDGGPDDQPKINLSDYLDAPHISDVTVRLAEIDSAYGDLLTEIRLSFAEYREADGREAAEEFDRVSFSYTGIPADMEADGDLLAALIGESRAVIGSDTLYPAYTNPQDPGLSTKSFEEQLIGVRPGERVEVLVTYPEDASAAGVDVTELRGKRIRFTLTVTALEKAELPEISDSLISRYTGGDFQSAAEFERDAYANIKAQYAYLALYNSVRVKSCPQELLDAETVRYIQSVILEQYDLSALTDAQIEKIYDELHDEALEYANAAIADRMISDYLCDYAGVTLSDAEYAAALTADFTDNAIAYSYAGIFSEDDLEERYGSENLRTAYRVNKLMRGVADLVRFV